MKRRHLKTEERREQIAEAVVEILRTGGLGGLTAEAVARSVGMVPSALYRHFPGKMAMLEAGMELLAGRIMERVDACMDDTGVDSDNMPAGEAGNVPECCGRHLDALYRILQTMTRMLHDMQVVPRILFSDETMAGHAEYKETVLRMQRMLLGRVRNLLAAGQAEGCVRADIAADKLAVAYMGMFVPVAVLYHSSGGAIDMQAHIHANWKFFLAGIAPCRDR